MYQKAIIIGNLGADPESRKSGDLSITNLRVATSSRNKGETITTWWRVVCFRQAADFAAQYLNKGSLVMIEGEVKQSKWTDKNGVERTTLELIASTVKSLGKREASQGNARPAPPKNGGAVGVDDSEIPF